MAFSLAIKNGDLAIANGSLLTVTGVPKMIQELRCWILTQMGSNPYQPAYGSLLEGGVKANGVAVESPIGNSYSSLGEIENFLNTEFQRIVSSYQILQRERIKEDQATYNKITLNASEILKGITDISYEQNQDALKVVLTLQNMEGQPSSLSISLEGEL